VILFDVHFWAIAGDAVTISPATRRAPVSVPPEPLTDPKTGEKMDRRFIKVPHDIAKLSGDVVPKEHDE